MDGASAVIARIVEYLQAGFAYAKSALDATASVVRGVVDGIIETARSLLGLQSGTAPPALNLFSEAGVQDGLITGSLLDGDGGLAGSLYSAVDLVNSLALSGLGETLETVIILTDTTLDPVIHLVDGTTQELVGTVHGTTDHLLYTTDRLVGAVTGTLDRLTGGASP
jgi:phage-related protein